MTWREEDTYPYVLKNLRRRYPKSEGWEIYVKDRWRGYETDFTVERIWRGRKERIIVEVKMECKIYERFIRQLNKYAKKLAGKGVKIRNKILVVPSFADTSLVPDDIEIMYLKGVKCEGNNIYWYYEE